MIFDIFVDLIFTILNFMISLIPKINLGGFEDALDWILRSFDQFTFIIQAFNYIAGFPVIPIVFVIFTSFYIFEFTISIIWFILHKTHIAGGGH